jgi:hypothetical protein
MRKINERKMGGVLLDLYDSAPKQFVKIVRGNDPKAVEKIFGPGNIDLREQLSPSAYQMVRKIADQVDADRTAAKQATKGTAALMHLLGESLELPRIPNQLNVVSTATNRVIDTIEKKLGKKTVEILARAANDGKALTQAIDTLPAVERVRTLRVLREAGLSPTSITRQAAGRATSAIGINALAGEPQEAR